MKTKNAGSKENLRKAHPSHKDTLKATKGPQARTTSSIPHPHAKKVTKGSSPIGIKGKVVKTAKPMKSKPAARPDMGNPAKIVFKRFGM